MQGDRLAGAVARGGLQVYRTQRVQSAIAKGGLRLRCHGRGGLRLGIGNPALGLQHSYPRLQRLGTGAGAGKAGAELGR